MQNPLKEWFRDRINAAIGEMRTSNWISLHEWINVHVLSSSGMLTLFFALDVLMKLK